MVTTNNKYAFPQEKPATQQELTTHIKNVEKTGYTMSFEQYNKKVAQWLNEH